MREYTVKQDGKIFAIECECVDRGGHRYLERIQALGSLDSIDFVDSNNTSSFCEICQKFTWIVLPK